MEQRSDVKVETYDGYTSPETPRAVHMLGKRYEVAEVLRRWRSPGGKDLGPEEHYRVRLRDYGECEIVYNRAFGKWDMKK
ncbi:MAG: hypothetical protein AB1742_00650 [bacterium]